MKALIPVPYEPDGKKEFKDFSIVMAPTESIINS